MIFFLQLALSSKTQENKEPGSNSGLPFDLSGPAPSTAEGLGVPTLGECAAGSIR